MNQSDVAFINTVRVVTPAAGADWSHTVPGHAIHRLVAFRGILTTSAAVATRIPALTISDGTDTYATIPAGAGITASKTGVVSSVAGAPAVGAADGPLLIPAPTDGILLLPGWKLSSVTAAIDVGDQWSAVRLFVVEYPTGPTTRQTPDVATIFEHP